MIKCLQVILGIIIAIWVVKGHLVLLVLLDLQDTMEFLGVQEREVIQGSLEIQV